MGIDGVALGRHERDRRSPSVNIVPADGWI
jgi:hypothetical protein